MTESSTEPPDSSGQRPGPTDAALSLFTRDKNGTDDPTLPIKEPLPTSNQDSNTAINTKTSIDQKEHPIGGNGANNGDATGAGETNEKTSNPLDIAGSRLATSPPTKDKGQGPVLKSGEGNDENSNNNPGGEDEKPNLTKSQRIMKEARMTFWVAITHSWINVLLICAPVGIAVAQIKSINGGVVFAINAVAIIPLAGLLSFATESVARKMGDSLGALLNVTFGNAVELIIFIIALVKNEIRIVQASLLGSILSNLLLILGMGFFMGGLRYQEQLYNSTVTQMSACLLSLSVISLVLPTAFHASFENEGLADRQSLKVSRGTSVILLLVYGIYLLFQLKSHAYLYESTPQHIVDAESTPGPAAAWLESSSSSDSSSSSSDSDSSSNTMRRRMKKVLRGGRRRKSSVASFDANELKMNNRSSSFGTKESPRDENASEASSSRARFASRNNTTEDLEEAIEDEGYSRHGKKKHQRHKHRKHKKSKKRAGSDGGDVEPTISERPENLVELIGENEPKRVDFAVPRDVNEDTYNELVTTQSGNKRPFPNLRGMSVKNVKSLTPTVFVKPSELPAQPPGPQRPAYIPRVRYGIRRTNSLPDRLNTSAHHQQQQYRAPGAMLSARTANRVIHDDVLPVQTTDEDGEDDVWHMSQPASIMLLLVSTALVAVCAEFMVGSIQEVTTTSSVGETFIGLIILPIVGNAAEHVTALTVAMKNKMDLAIGVAVGSSIQIAIFVTPLVVILGWIMDKDMSLYFTLFETVCLFVSAFMVNFLVLDGRSNYLEGALLCAVYVIIAIVAFFYPEGKDASAWGQ